jgi:hypothetical protein
MDHESRRLPASLQELLNPDENHDFSENWSGQSIPRYCNGDKNYNSSWAHLEVIPAAHQQQFHYRNNEVA